ncbi:MAG: GNAT family N-acetyltransferase [Roseibium sp.]
MNVTLRPAEERDAEALAQCIDRAYERYKTNLPSLPDVSNGIEQDIANHHVFVAESEDCLAGGAVLMINDHIAVLANIAVDPKQSGKGIGRLLIEQIEGAARDHGCTELRLTTHPKMPDNVALYQHIGWLEQDRSETKVRMSKLL